MFLTFSKPTLAGAQPRERLVSCIAAAVCIGLTAMSCSWSPGTAAALPVSMAPLGASAVLVLAVPTSPLAQPWPVIGGYIPTALFGVAVFRLVPDPAAAARIAVGGAILLMSLLQCLHPPGGAAALTAVIGSDAVHQGGYGFAILPAGLNSAVLVLLAIVAHLVHHRSYPDRSAFQANVPVSLRENDLADEDVDAALAEMDKAFDIDHEDLQLLLSSARRHARLRCGQGAGLAASKRADPQN